MNAQTLLGLQATLLPHPPFMSPLVVYNRLIVGLKIVRFGALFWVNSVPVAGFCLARSHKQLSTIHCGTGAE